ncbi:MAG: hypothetical protein KME35_03775 [Aphanocapsa sp. GSE-SYN-MK-11-07L]|nr:hypothetical protein [Aphanocapsa sp. GSE-SYN-MK-11-07L]
MQLSPLPGYKTQSIDTSIETELVLFSLLRNLSIDQKAERLAKWTKGCWELNLAGIQRRHPNASPGQIRAYWAESILGKALVEQLPASIVNQNQTLMLTDPISLALDVARILDALDIPYLIGGSVASGLWGESRPTEDIDVVANLLPEKVAALMAAFTPRFYVSEDAVRDAIRDQQSFNLIDNDSLGKVDIFILKDTPFEQTEFQRRQSYTIREPNGRLIFSTPEDIILQKLLWYRMTQRQSQKQWRDILGVLKLQGQRLDFGYLQAWGSRLKLLTELNQALTESGLTPFAP